jgi:Predicted membrane protein
MNTEDNSKKITSKLKLYESVPFGMLLSLIGGYLDAYTYISRDGVFANAQTGNIVLLGIHAARGEWKQVLIYIPPILAFVIGVITVEIIKKAYPGRYLIHWAHFILILETIILFLLGFVPPEFPNGIVTVSISFVAAVQVCSFNKLVDSSYATTMMTGNLRSFSQAIYKAIADRDRVYAIHAARYFAVILSFILGAVIGGIVTNRTGIRAVWGSVVILIGLILLSIAGKNKNK